MYFLRIESNHALGYNIVPTDGIDENIIEGENTGKRESAENNVDKNIKAKIEKRFFLFH
jgi:hypothetical protein